MVQEVGGRDRDRVDLGIREQVAVVFVCPLKSENIEGVFACVGGGVGAASPIRTAQIVPSGTLRSSVQTVMRRDNMTSSSVDCDVPMKMMPAGCIPTASVIVSRST